MIGPETWGLDPVKSTVAESLSMMGAVKSAIDPDGIMTESDEGNNNCPANVVDVAIAENYLYLPLVLK